MTLLEEIRAALANRNVQAFLRSPIREGESSQDTTAYWWLYGSTKAAPRLADSLGDHPRVKTYEAYDGQFIKNGKLDYTTAAGAYQITATTWDTVIQPALHLPDFTPESQDMAAVYLLKHRRALDDVMAGRFGAACGKLQQEWASMPGASYGDQPTQQMARVLALYKQYGGALEPQGATNAPAPAPTARPAPAAPPAASIPAGDAGDAPENNMPIPALIGVLATSLIDAFAPLAREKITKEIARHTDSPQVADQVAAAVIETVKTATGKSDPIEAVATAKADPAVMQQAEDSALATIEKLAPFLDKIEAQERQAFADSEASRRAAQQHNADDPLMIDFPWLKLKFIHVLSIAFVSFSGWFVTMNWSSLTPELKGAVITLMIIAGWNGVRDYWMGSSRSSSAKDVVIGELSRRKS
jgi:lysozyme